MLRLVGGPETKALTLTAGPERALNSVFVQALPGTPLPVQTVLK